MNRTKALLASVLVATVVLMAGCGGAKTGSGSSGGAPGSKDGGTLIIGTGADATGLDPELVMNNESGYVMSLLYDRLVSFKPGTSEVAPGLADSWDVAPDGKVYTFHIHSGVKFHDGTPLTAQAIAADFDRVVNPNNKYYYKNLQGVNSYAGDTFGNVSKVEATDVSTLKFTLKAPYAPFLTNLAMVWSGVTNPKQTEAYGFDSSQHPSGTGPFKLVEWVKNDHITVEANKEYWKGRPHLDKVIFKIVPENSVRVLKLQKGELDTVLDVSPEDYTKLKSDPNVTLLEQPGLTINGVGLPVDTAPFDKKEVRQALNYATDKKQLNDFLYKGLAVEMTQLVPQVDWSYNPDVKGYPYDLNKAKELLAKAGYPNGFNMELLTYPNPRGYNPIGGQLAVALQEQWQKIGVKVTIKQLEWGAFLQAIRTTNNHSAHLRGWSGDNGDPDNFLATLESTKAIPVGNTSHYTNPQVDSLLDQAVKVTDQAQRKTLYQQANAILADDAPWVMVNSTKQVRAVAKKVQGFTLNPLQMLFDFDQVYLQK